MEGFIVTPVNYLAMGSIISHTRIWVENKRGPSSSRLWEHTRLSGFDFVIKSVSDVRLDSRTGVPPPFPTLNAGKQLKFSQLSEKS